jgi:flagellar basal body-associated protein FliL
MKSSRISELKQLAQELSDRDVRLKDYLKEICSLMNCPKCTDAEKLAKLKEIVKECQPLVKMGGMNTQNS